MNSYKYKAKYISLVKYLSAMFLFALLITSCDVVDGNYRETTQIDTTTKVKRKILLEEFTGFRCKNCPTAAALIRDLQALYGEQLITVAVHSGYFAKPNPNASYSYDFRTPMGTALDDFFGVSAIGNPFGMVNRIGYNTDYIFGKDDWSTKISSMINDSPKMTIELNPSYTESTRTISVDVNIKYLTEGSTSHNLVLCVVEDSIVNYQLNGSVEVLDYVHNHVLRGDLNGTWGSQISETAVAANTTIKKTIKYVIPEGKDWRLNKLKIVAYIYDFGQTYEVYQAEETPLIK